MPTFLIYTLGCKVNQYESQYVREGLERLGFQEARAGEKVDIGVVNTCTVTAESDLKSRKIIRHLARQHPEAKLVVMGCYASRAPQDLANLPGVVQLIRDKAELPEWLRQLGLADPPQGISSFGPRHRAFVKVQDGCQQRCRYCIVPLVRPMLRSRFPQEVLEEIQRLVWAGYREIVLTGIHLGHYGLDLPAPRPSLTDLVKEILELPGSFRVRLSSLEAMEIRPELLRLLSAQADRFCPHLHLPLQTGSNSILDRMGRPYRLEDFLKICDQIRFWLDSPALTTDILIGFPGETEEDFQATCRAVEQVGFSKIHIFPFSPRPGTPAAQMPDRPPVGVVRCRCEQMRHIAQRLRRQYMESLLGRTVQVLVEEVLDTTDKEDLSLPLSTPLKGEYSTIPCGHFTSGSLCKIRLNSHTTQNSSGSCSGKSYWPQNAAPNNVSVLRGTSERYVPVYFLGSPSWIGQLLVLQPQGVFEPEQDRFALWAGAIAENPCRV